MQPVSQPDTYSLVMQMKQQGYSNDQIMQYMQQQGIDSSEVLNLLNQMEPPRPPPAMMAQGGNERIEEVAEAIINEKCNEVVKDMNKIAEWKEQAENRLSRMEQDLKNLRENFQTLHQGILGKVQQYDQNIQNVGAEIKAMEKVFQQILPKFTENVNKLARIADKN